MYRYTSNNARQPRYLINSFVAHLDFMKRKTTKKSYYNKIKKIIYEKVVDLIIVIIVKWFSFSVLLTPNYSLSMNCLDCDSIIR